MQPYLVTSEEWAAFTELNAEMAPQCDVITEKKEPLADS